MLYSFLISTFCLHVPTLLWKLRTWQYNMNSIFFLVCYNLVMLFLILSDSWPVWTIISYYLALIVSSLLYLWLSVASRSDSHYSLIWHSSKLNLLSFSYLSLDWCFHSLLSSYLVLYISLLIFSLLLCFMFSHSCSLYDSLNTFLTCLYLKFMTLSYLVLWVLVYKPHCMFLIL